MLAQKHINHPRSVRVSNAVNVGITALFAQFGVTPLDTDTAKMDAAADKLLAAILNAIDAK